MLSETLKEETLQPHQQLEKHLILKIKSIESVSDYTSILKLFYGFISPIEKQIESEIGNHVGDMALRRKSAALADDIRYFEDFNTQNAVAGSQQNLPEIMSAENAMGALYVFEGSTLGGEIITKLISSKLNISQENGFAFFRSYDNNRMKMWNLFKSDLDKFGNKTNEQQIVDSAKQTFTLFYNWLSRHENDK